MAKSKHDPFFSRSMEHMPIAQAFFHQHWPTHLHPPLRDTLTRVDRTNTHEKLKKRHKDITYEAQIASLGPLLANVEQQSQPDIMMPMRLLQYSVDSLAPYLREYKQIPLILNFLLYNGAPSPYPYHNTLQDYYSHPQWGSQELALRFYLIDLPQISDKVLLTHGHCAPMEILLKHGRDGKFELPVQAYQAIFQACIDTVGNDYLITMLTYALSLSNIEAGERTFHFLETVFTNKTETIMTYGDKIRQEAAREAAHKAAREAAQAEKMSLARTMLTKGYDPNEVSTLTGISSEAMHQIHPMRPTL